MLFGISVAYLIFGIQAIMLDYPENLTSMKGWLFIFMGCLFAPDHGYRVYKLENQIEALEGRRRP